MDVPPLVHVNALLNTTATVLLVVGLFLIKRKRIDAHRKVMMSAFGASTLFLISYLTNRAMHGGMFYNGDGIDRVMYLVILFSHMVLAAIVPVLAILLIRFGLKGRVESHKKLARWAYPIWMYVSITGVVIYLMLVWFNPAPPAA